MASISFPSSPSNGDTYTFNGVTYEYNSAKSQWIIQTGTSLANVNINAISGSMVPSANVTYDLGSATNAWKDLHLSGNTIYLGASQIRTTNDGAVVLPANSRVGATAIATSGGGAGEVIDTTLTKTFTANEEYTVTLSNEIAISPIVSATKEVAPSDVITKSNWDVLSGASNYDLEDTAYDTTLLKTTQDVPGQVDQVRVHYTGRLGNATNYGSRDGFFKDDGTKFYTLTTLKMIMYDLNTPYHPEDGFTKDTQGDWTMPFSTSSWDMIPSSNGTKAIAITSTTMNELEFTTGWDFHSYSSTTQSVTFSSLGITFPGSVFRGFFKYDGTALYVFDSLESITKINFSTPWDITTYSSHVSSSRLSEVYNMTFCGWNYDGTILYTWNNSNSYGKKYLAAVPWEVDNFTYIGSWYPDGLSTLATWRFANNGKTIVLPGADYYYIGDCYITRPVLQLGSGSFSVSDVGKKITSGLGSAVLKNTAGEFVEEGVFPSTTIASGDWSMTALTGDENGITIPSISMNFDLTNPSTSETYTSNSLDKFDPPEVTSIYGFRFSTDGTKLFVLCDGTDTVYRYDLSISFDIATTSVTPHSSFTLSNTSQNQAIEISSDGLYIYIFRAYRYIIQISLSTAYDLSTASETQTFDYGSAVIRGMSIKPDGTKFYLYNPTADVIYQYTASSAHDLTTLSPSATSNSPRFSYGTPGNISYLQFANNGKYIMWYDSSTSTSFLWPRNQIVIYECATEWDVSNLSFVTSNQARWTAGTAGPFFINNEGTKLWLADTGDEAIRYFDNIAGSLSYASMEYSSAITNQSGQISTASWADINSMIADETQGSNSEIYYAISTDGKSTFKVITNGLSERSIVRNNDGTWQYNSNNTYASETWENATVNTVHGSLKDAIQSSNTNKMDSTLLNTITDTYHFVLDDTLDLAIIMKTLEPSMPVSDGITIDYTGALKQQSAILGTDYTYVHNSNTQVTILALNAGNYKFRII